MFDQKKLDRINFLAKKNKEEGLTKEELAEREVLRSRLDNVKVVHTQEEYDELMKKNQN